MIKQLILEGPPPGWFSSQSIPSSAHLAWLLVTEFNSLNEEYRKEPRMGDPPSDFTLPESVLNKIEFEILLYCTFTEFPEATTTVVSSDTNIHKLNW